MPWSSAFLDVLRNGGPVRWDIERLRWPGSPGASTDTATSYHTASGRVALSALPSISGQSVTVPTWTSNRGRFSVGLGGTAAGLWAASDMPRGSLCQVSARVPGGVSGGDVVARGRVNGISGVGPLSVLECWDITAALMTRPSFAAGSESILFANADPDSSHTATLSARYTPGDSMLSLASTANMERETGGAGAVLVTPAGGGEPFVLRYAGTSGSTVTGITGAVLGTVGVVAPVGSTVQEVAFIEDHPIVAALKILMSTGTGTNGIYDTLPETWGLGAPASAVDIAGALAWANLMDPASGNHSVRVYSTTAQDQGLAWLLGELARYGVWPAMRQGEITLRACVDRSATSVPVVMRIDRGNTIAVLPQREVWDGSSPVEYEGVVITDGGSGVAGSASAPPVTRPAVPLLPIAFDGGELYQNFSYIGPKLAERLGAWRFAVPSVIRLQATLEAAQVCPGDWVEVGLDGLWTPYATGSPVREAMVSSVVTDWARGAVSLTLHLPGPA